MNSELSTYWGSKLRSSGPMLMALPPKLVRSENVDFLMGTLGVVPSAIDAILHRYAASADLLALLNAPMVGALPKLPHLGVIVNSRGTFIYVDSEQLHELPHFCLTVCKDDGDIAFVFNCPLLFILITAPTIVNRYVAYSHSFGDGGPCYVGITKRGWPARWSQHLTAARSGSPYLFHEAIRRAGSNCPVHGVLACNLHFDEAMNIEEAAVAATSLYPKGLNMIPGGFAGLRYLAKQGFKPHPRNFADSWDRRHIVIQQFTSHCSRAGKPNPLAAALWQDDKYASSVICTNPNNFTLEQVRMVRYMDSIGHSMTVIAEHLRCGERRVHALLSGDTYSRVK